MSLNVVSLFSRPARPRSWSNQELAEFYRVQESLARAGLEVETEQGLSDEGEPWFVFCRADNDDVIIHFARIDGLYVVASPAFGSCVRGHDFRALIEGLMEQHPVVMPREKERGKFFIHPAALLVALVTTAFFKLYQGDALAAEAQGDGHGPLLAAGGTRAASTQSHAVALEERAAATLMVAVAAAVAWEQVRNPADQIEPVHSALDDHSAALLNAVVPDAPATHASLQAIGAVGHQPAALDPGPAIVHDSPVMPASPAPTAPQPNSDPLAPSVKLADAQQQVAVPDGASVPAPGDAGGAPESLRHPAEAPPSHAAQPQASGDPHVVAEGSGSPTASAALAEVRAMVGELLQTHLATTTADASQQQVVLTLANANPPIPHDGDAPLVSPAAASEPSEAAHPSGNGKSAPAFSATPAAPPVSTVSAVDHAIHDFILDHADFQIIKLDQEVIMYDPALTPSNSHYAEQESFTFSDGSSLFLIGLPQHNPGSGYLT